MCLQFKEDEIWSHVDSPEVVNSEYLSRLPLKTFIYIPKSDNPGPRPFSPEEKCLHQGAKVFLPLWEKRGVVAYRGATPMWAPRFMFLGFLTYGRDPDTCRVTPGSHHETPDTGQIEKGKPM